MKLVPQTSSLSHWIPFLEDASQQSYSYLLKFEEKNNQLEEEEEKAWTNRSQLDQWFRALHPSHYTPKEGASSWTDVYYKGEKLLRKTAWTTHCQCDYGYSDTWQTPATHPEFKEVVQEITQAVIAATGCTSLNCCNLNYYPQGGGVGWHADDEFLFDARRRPTCIVSLSLCSSSSGGARKFMVRPQLNGIPEDAIQNQYDSTTTAAQMEQVVLGHGDMLTMEGMFQNHYFHSVWPGDSKTHSDDPLTQGERINLTWRTIVQHMDGSEECRGKVCPLSKHNGNA